jgi:hypothetical protein
MGDSRLKKYNASLDAAESPTIRNAILEQIKSDTMIDAAKHNPTHPEQTRAVLRRAQAELARGKTLSRVVAKFLRLALGRYLDEGVALDRAFGLTKARGRPRLSLKRKHRIALAVLEVYLKCEKSVDSAAQNIPGIERSRALEIFSEHKGPALRLLKLARGRLRPPPLFTATEERRLKQLYRIKD